MGLTNGLDQWGLGPKMGERCALPMLTFCYVCYVCYVCHKIRHMTQDPTNQSIFRKAALERLSSPEQLDKLVTLTDPRGWLALLSFGLLLIVLLSWGIMGTIPTNVQAAGILISQGGQVVDAMTPAAGRLETLRVHENDLVERDQVVALLRQTQIEQQLGNARQLVEEREQELARLRLAQQRELRLKKANFAARREAISRSIEAAEARAGYLERVLALQEAQVDKGYIPRHKIEEQRTELNKVRQEIADAHNNILELEADELDLVILREQELNRVVQRISEARRQVNELEVKLRNDSTVKAPASGRVTEVKLSEGSVVGPGQAVLSIEVGGAGLQVMAFVPTEHGKKIRAGMQVRIEPSTIKKEEHGTLLGVVDEISEFPVTPEGMKRLLQNENLVMRFTEAGPPYLAQIDLLEAATPSGYRWSGGGAPLFEISSGTTVETEITIREQAPISLVIPLLKKYTGIYW